MAIYTDEEASKILLRPKNADKVYNAALQEERLIYHSEPILERINLPYMANRNFTYWWQGLVHREKHQKLNNLMQCPLSTVSISKEIFDQLQKFVDAQDRYIEFKFVTEDYTIDYNKFLDSQNDDSFWRYTVINAIKNKICSYVVVDMPVLQKGERPEPYNYFVSPASIIDVEINEYKGCVEYIAFKQSKFKWNGDNYNNQSSLASKFVTGDELERVIFIDDVSYRVMARKLDSSSEYEVIYTSKHNLGYCPVIDFWRDSIRGSNGINKIGPLTLQLSDFDYVLFFKACIDYMNLYGPFPVLVTYDMEEEENDEKSVNLNEGQYQSYSTMNALNNSEIVSDPSVSDNKFIAPGGGFTVPVPASHQDHNFMTDPMKFVGMESLTIKTANELLEAKQCEIKRKCTGVNDEYLNEIAKNTEMLSSSFRKEETILTWIKSNIERVHKFVTKTKCYLRYGEEYFRGAVIDYGSDYMLKDATTLSDEFKKSKDNGMPQSYSYEIAKSASITRFKNNTEKLGRLQILLDIEPYPNMSWEEFNTLAIAKSDKINFVVKANFITFVNQFERENGSIVDFGSKISYNKKISIIKKTIEEYANKLEWSEPDTTGSAGGDGLRKPKQ
jgi:hypothetical protein